LGKYKAIVLPYLLMMDEEEARAIREYVRSGGRLYASYYAGLFDKEGNRKDFLLSDVFGVSYVGETKESVTYISPSSEIPELFGDITPQAPLTLFHSQLLVKPLDGAEVMAKICLPYTDPSDSTRFVSIHSNPPGIITDYPAIIRKRYGEGEVIWCAGPLEMMGEERHRGFFLRLLKSLVKEGFIFEADAPKSVEITMFRKEEGYIVNLLNFQTDLPNIPVFGIKLRIKVGDRAISKALLLPSGTSLPFEVRNQDIELEIPRLDTFLMLWIQ